MTWDFENRKKETFLLLGKLAKENCTAQAMKCGIIALEFKCHSKTLIKVKFEIDQIRG